MPDPWSPWLNLLQTFGLAVTILASLGFALWKTARWFGQEIVLPVRDKMIARIDGFLSSLNDSIQSMEANMDRLVDGVTQQGEALKQCQANAGRFALAGKDDFAARTEAQIARLSDELRRLREGQAK